MSKPKKVMELKDGELFRVVGPRGVAPDVWVWEGRVEGINGFLIRRARDNFSIVVDKNDFIVPLDLEGL